MAKKHLATASWLVLCLATFGMGWMFKPVPESSESAAARSSTTSGKSSRGDFSPRSGEQDSSRAPIGSKAAEAGVPGVLPGASRPLSSAAIEELGGKFRATLDPIDRRTAFLKLLDGMTVDNARKIREQIAHLSSEDPAFRDFHYAWGKIGGVEAIMNGAETRKRDMTATLSGWASADPAAAKAWFESLEDQGKESLASQAYLRAGLVSGLADADPHMAAQFVLGMTTADNELARHMLGIVTGKFLQSEGPVAAAAWADSLPQGEIRSSAMSRIARDYVSNDPAAAAAWAAGYSGEPEGNRVIDQVGSHWAYRDPNAAVEWLESLPPSEGRSEGLNSAFSSWAGRNPEEAGNHINQMPQSTERDHAISGYATRMVYENPSAALAWADAVSDPAFREQTLIRTGQIYYRRDPNAAREWLANSGLSPESQQRVVERRHDDRRKERK